MEEIRTTNNLTGFTGYDYSLALCHMDNWGLVYLDEYGAPMEIEDVENMMREAGELHE